MKSLRDVIHDVRHALYKRSFNKRSETAATSSRDPSPGHTRQYLPTVPVAPNSPQVEPQSSLPVVTPDIVKQTTQDSVQNNQHAPDSSGQANPLETMSTTDGALNNADPSASADGTVTQPAPEEDPEITKL